MNPENRCPVAVSPVMPTSERRVRGPPGLGQGTITQPGYTFHERDQFDRQVNRS